MRLLPSRFPSLLRIGFSCAVLAAVCLLGACDRHSAEEVPESYGHGSSRNRNFNNHAIDSENGTHSFSDTQGTAKEGVHPEGHEPEKKAEADKESGRFFPKGS